MNQCSITYKTVNGLELRMEAWVPDRPTGRPILFFHGGAGILGSRLDVPDLDVFMKHGCALFSADYRLAPESKMNDIVSDCEDAYAWLLREGLHVFGLREEPVAVSGFSFGGYMAQLMGVRLLPRPKAVLSFSGYGDLLGQMYLREDPYYSQAVPAKPEDYIQRQVTGSPLAGPGVTDRLSIYFHTRQKGNWIQEVLGLDPSLDLNQIIPYCPVRMMLPDAAPVFIYHGLADSDVPYSQALLSQAMLQAAGVRHELMTGEGGHELNGERMRGVMLRALDFLSSLN